MNMPNVFDKKISLDYQTRTAPVMYPFNAEFDSVAGKLPPTSPPPNLFNQNKVLNSLQSNA